MYPENQPYLRRRDAALEAALDCANELFAGIEKAARLNIQTVKTSLSEQQALMDATLSAQTISEVIDLQSQQYPASVTKTFAYWRHVEDIAIQTQSGVFAAVREHIGRAIGTAADTFSGASAGLAEQARSDAANLLVTAQRAAPSSDPVTILGSDGQVVSSNDVRGEMH
jgi:phasin family protein